MDRERFEELVDMALQDMPAEFRERLENIAIVVEDWPTQDQLNRAKVRHRQQLLGLYEGVPLTKRSRWISMKLPDKITIFQKPIENSCRYDKDIVKTIREVVYHEVAHYFGISDKRLRDIERGVLGNE